MGVYSKILKQAYEITRQYSFLWIFGLFLSLVDVAAYSLVSIKGNQIKGYQNGYMSIGIILILIIFVLLSYRIKTALIIAIKAITDKQQISSSKSFRSAKFFYGRVFNISLLMEVSNLILILLVYVPVAYISSHGQMVTAKLLGIKGAVILLPLPLTFLLFKIIQPFFFFFFYIKINKQDNKSPGLITQ